MLQYHPFLENTVYYNVCENGKFSTVTHNFVTGEKKYTDRATACVSPDGKWGLAINFGRIYAFRPGYGYAAFKDENADVNHPENDGIYLTNMESGKSEFLISYKDLAPIAGFSEEEKILVNHITFNRSSDRFVALVRNFPRPGIMWSKQIISIEIILLCGTYHRFFDFGFIRIICKLTYDYVAYKRIAKHNGRGYFHKTHMAVIQIWLFGCRASTKAHFITFQTFFAKGGVGAYRATKRNIIRA